MLKYYCVVLGLIAWGMAGLVMAEREVSVEPVTEELQEKLVIDIKLYRLRQEQGARQTDQEMIKHVASASKPKQAVQQQGGGFHHGLLRYHPFTELKCAACHSPSEPLEADWKAVSVHSFINLECSQCHTSAANQWPELMKSLHFQWPDYPTQQMKPDSLVTQSDLAELLVQSEVEVVMGQKTSVTIKGMGDDTLSYFEALGDGLFRHETMTNPSNVKIQFLARPDSVDANNVRLETCKVSITAVREREKIDGVALGIGKPLIKTSQIEKTLVCAPDQLQAFTLDSPAQGRILVLVRLKRSSAESPTQQ